ncbi:CPBP family glutamic-type intramembrane protease [Flavobacterium sp. CAU 1735]|uniref:CPBP family glutamic-type intramembrane protease n=1 Tax=Flavobacterium sp. CAU 1735 TaxID=3140361 RepID=UPI003261967E
MLILKHFVWFVLFPSKEIITSNGIKDKINSILFLILLNFVFLLFSSLLTVYLLPDFQSAYPSEQGVKWLFLFPIIIAPLREEILFRLYLKYSRFNLSCFLGILTLVLTLLVSSEVIFENWLPNTLAFLSGGMVFICSFIFLKKYDHLFDYFFKRHVRLFVIFSVITFGYLHLPNFKITREILFLSPLILLPYFMAGFIFSYIRLHFGFIYSVMTHMMINLLGTSILVLFQ